MTPFKFASAAALTIGMLASSSACATGYGYGDRGVYRDGRYGNAGYAREVERRAYDNGFREGLREGERDARSRHRYEPARHDDWRDANNGYRREYGDRNFYRQNFRSGFEAGYSQGFRRYDNGRYRR